MKIVFGLVLALVMGAITVISYEVHVLKFAWAKAALLLVPALGTWGYLYIRKVSRGERLPYFTALGHSIGMGGITFALYGLFVFFLSNWVITPAAFEHIDPFELSLLILMGGTFLSCIFAFIAVPYFRRKNRESKGG